MDSTFIGCMCSLQKTKKKIMTVSSSMGINKDFICAILKEEWPAPLRELLVLLTNNLFFCIFVL